MSDGVRDEEYTRGASVYVVKKNSILSDCDIL